MKNVIKINASEYIDSERLSQEKWDAGYSILFDAPNVKYLLIDVLDGIEVVVSKIVHPFGAPYYVSIPRRRVSTNMLSTLMDAKHTIFELRWEHSVGFMCDKHKDPPFTQTPCQKGIRLVSAFDAITIACVLQDLGDF